MKTNGDRIIEEIKTTGETALRKVYRAYRLEFMNWGKKHFSAVDERSLEDAYHDALEIFYRNVVSGKLIKLDAPVQNYLIGIGKYKLLQSLKNNKRMDYVDQYHETPDGSVQNFLDSIVEKEMDAEKKQKLIAAFDKLSGICKKLLIQRYYEARQMEEIVVDMKYDNINTARAAVSRCLKNLKNLTV